MAGIESQAGRLPGVRLFKPPVFEDARGFFTEFYHQGKYAEAGLDMRFVQDNLSRSTHGVLRGLHYQLRHPQGKLVAVLVGEVFDVAVDIRRGSPTFGQWEGYRLSATNRHQLYVPPGFAHGFVVLSDYALFFYKCTDIYRQGDDHGLAWNDPDIGIDWPLADPVLSAKDAALPRLRDVPAAQLPSA